MKLYVNWLFLENVFLAEEQTDQHFFIQRLLKTPQDHVELVVDFDMEAAYLDPQKKAVVRQIAQRLPGFNAMFLTSCQTRQFHESGEPKLVFVDGIPLDIDQRFGCFWTSSATLQKADFLFHTEPFRILREQKDWSILSKIKHPCNALVLTDNYLFQNDRTHENIASILSSLMPDVLEDGFVFELTIIGYPHQPTKPDDPESIIRDLTQKAKAIGDLLKKRFTYQISLSVIPKYHHGRYIHTNYFRIISEKGFGLFRKGTLSLQNETSIDCQPVTYKGIHSTVLSTRTDELKKCRTLWRDETRGLDTLVGQYANRLFE
jgi:hypothetical protein